MWYWHEGMGWWMLFGGFWMIVFWGGIIALIVWGITRLTRGGGSPSGGKKSEAFDIARERYARGEISKEEFDQIKRDLTS